VEDLSSTHQNIANIAKKEKKGKRKKLKHGRKAPSLATPTIINVEQHTSKGICGQNRLERRLE
jgi:hypothetical protein